MFLMELLSVPYKEDDAVNPQTVYGASKLEGEKAGIEIQSRFNHHPHFMGVFRVWEKFCEDHAEIDE